MTGAPSTLVPEDVPVLVMRSLENARAVLHEGDAAKAVKLCTSTDSLCQKMEAPPPIHGLCLTILGDAQVAAGKIDEARETFLRGIKLNKAAENRPGMPEDIKRDLRHRLGDLYAALGGAERSVENWIPALRALRNSVDYFELAQKPELQASSMLGVATVLFARGEVKDALKELEEVELQIGNSEDPNRAECQMLLANTLMNQGHCYISLGDSGKARELWQTAKGLADGAGDAHHAEQIAAALVDLDGEAAAVANEAFTN